VGRLVHDIPTDPPTKEKELYSMEHKNRNFLSSCAQTDFGRIPLSRTEKAFYKRFNAEILSLCRSLPNSVQTDALLFLMQYSGITLGQELDFFSNYYPPAWSILYWLSQENTFATKRLKVRDVTSAVTAQSMAMFLHSLDDHLTDNQISVSPLTLLLRSQAWTIMNRAFCYLTENLPGGTRKVRSLVDDYHAGIRDSEGLNSLDSYCDRFRKQMALGMVAPTLLSMKVAGRSNFIRDLQIAYGSFGISWRLLDDIRDIGNDMKRGAPSAIYLCLPKKIRTRWNTPGATNRTGAGNSTKPILNHILERGLVERIKDRICIELETAASIVEAYDLRGFARELRYLALPLRSSSRP
jgi:hypothetical protein